MGGTNVSQTPSTQITGESGNIGAGAGLTDSVVMPLDLAGSANNTVSITDLSPQAINAATNLAERVLASSDLVTTGALNFATSASNKANELAGASTGAGPATQTIKTIGIVVGSIVAIVAIAWSFTSGRKKQKEAA